MAALEVVRARRRWRSSTAGLAALALAATWTFAIVARDGSSGGSEAFAVDQYGQALPPYRVKEWNQNVRKKMYTFKNKLYKIQHNVRRNTPYAIWVDDYKDKRKPRYKYDVVLLRDHPTLGSAGETKRVRPGRYRRDLLPNGYAIISDGKVQKALEEAQAQARTEQDAAQKALEEAQAQARTEQDAAQLAMLKSKKAIEAAGTVVVEKKVRPGSDKLYGSVTPVDIEKVIKEKTGIPIRTTAVTVPSIDVCGEYSASIDMGAGVSAFITVKVQPEGTAAREAEEAAAAAEKAAKEAAKGE